MGRPSKSNRLSARKQKALKENHLPSPNTIVQILEAAGELKRPKFDHFLELRIYAYHAIAAAWNRIDSEKGRYTPEEVEIAKDFLRELGNRARSTGKPRGDKPQASENRRMLDAFWWLSQGGTVKDIAIDAKGPDRYVEEMHSLSVRLKRFSQRVRRVVRRLYGCDEKGQVPAGFLEHEKSCMRLASLFGSVRQWPGIDPHSREHGYALCEALRRYDPARSK
jgi:hypothetical protein